MPETTPLIKAALNLRVGAGFDVYNVYECSAFGLQRHRKAHTRKGPCQVIPAEASFMILFVM